MPGAAHDAVVALGPAIESLTGRAATREELARFRTYLGLLLEWNRVHRVTGYRSGEDIVRHLFLDGLLFLARLSSGPMTMVDLGTGPGIPGVPIRIIKPEISLTLIEAKRKYVSFLAALKRGLNMPDIVVLEGRAERLVEDHPDLAEAFDVVVTRAVGAALLPKAMEYLKPGGLFLAGGPSSPGNVIADAVPGLEARWERVTLEGLGLNRAFIVGRKREA